VTNFGNRWRLVCHACGFKFEEGLAFNVKDAPCCSEPEIHVHNILEPCRWCDSGTEYDPETGWHKDCVGSCKLAGDAYCAKDYK